MSNDFPSSERFYGLVNFGNTCYSNSVLQALYACTPFREKILDYYALNKRRKESDSMLMCLATLFHKISSSKRRSGVLGPTNLIKKLKKLNPTFDGPQHQDAQEFLNFMLNEVADNLREDEKKKRQNELYQKQGKTLSEEQKKKIDKETWNMDTWVQSIFEGTLTNETKCLRCETVTSRDEKFLDLPLDVEPNCSITYCLSQFSASEMLHAQDKYLCDNCCCHQEASKCMKLKQLPRVAVLHFKRFKYIERLGAFKKLCYRVVFPFHLRLVNTVKDVKDAERIYRLIAVVFHIGSGTTWGHYACFVKCHDSWFLFDDEKITVVEEEKVMQVFGSEHVSNPKCKQDGYLLFYEMENPD